VIDVNSLSDYIQGVAPTAAWKKIVGDMLRPMDPIMTTAYKFTDSKILNQINILTASFKLEII